MKKTLSFIAASMMLCGSVALAQTPAQSPSEQVTAQAQPQTENQDSVIDQIRIKLMTRVGARANTVKPAPIPGLYEAVIGNDIIYVDKDVDHIVMGQIFDTKTRKNLTQEAQEALKRIDFASLPLKDAIKTVNGDGSRTIAVFSDPNCGFCKKLESNLKDMKNVTIYTFLYPVITPTSKDISADIWCSKNPSEVWRKVMIEGKLPAKRSESCDTSALDRNVELGTSLMIDGTPTVFVPSGSRAPGAATIEHLEKMLENK